MHDLGSGCRADAVDTFPATAAAGPRPEPPLMVLKFGSSVLRTVHDLPRVAGEIYRQARRGARVVAIVSALGDETDALIAAAGLAAGDTRCSGLAEVVSLGEEKTAALLRVACDRIGLSARVCRPEEAGILASGDLMEAQPVRLCDRLQRLVATSSDVLIVPGFVGVDRSGRRALLGRGGSDFSAIFIGGEARADIVRLYKDVDGVYPHDPRHERVLHRFDEVSWSDCLTLARPLLQPRAVEYAQARQLDIEVGAIGGRAPTLVTARTTLPRPWSPPPRLRIALAGYGTVGQALRARLDAEPDFEIAAILVRDPAKPRTVSPPVALTADIDAFAATPCDILIDVTCGEEAGLALCRAQLEKGGDVVSANKRIIGGHIEDLLGIAERSQARLRHSATVGGSMPILEAVRRLAEAEEISGIEAVLNGTVNFLLDQIAAGAPYPAALAAAQTAGFAEADPVQDLSGEDAAMKLRILARLLTGGRVRDMAISVEPLDAARVARIAASGERWLQISSLTDRDNVITGSVSYRPARTLVGIEAPAAEGNVARIRTRAGHCLVVSGRGAGGAATAESIMADLFDIRGERLAPRAAPGPGPHPTIQASAS